MDSDFSPEMNKIGLHIYTAGIAVQELFIVLFCGLIFAFHRRMREGTGDYSRGPHWHTLVIAMYGTLGCITVSTVKDPAQKGVGNQSQGGHASECQFDHMNRSESSTV